MTLLIYLFSFVEDQSYYTCIFYMDLLELLWPSQERIGNFETKPTVMPGNHIDPEFLASLRFEPLTKTNWPHFEQLFGVKGACGNCWCMYYRLNKAEFTEGKVNNGNKEAMKKLVWEGRPTGMLGFYKDIPIDWCAFAPRPDFLKLSKSRVHKPIDDKLVWSIPCTFIDKKFRKQGVSVALLKGVVDYAREVGIKIIEAYPTTPTKEKLPDSFAWIGLFKSFERAGFEIVDRTSKNRPMVRYYVNR